MRTGEAVCELSGHRGAVLDMVMKGDTGNMGLSLVNNVNINTFLLMVRAHSK